MKKSSLKITSNDRPGDTSKQYINIETNAIAKIISYKDKYKTLILQYSDGSDISITYGTFNKYWREYET